MQNLKRRTGFKNRHINPLPTKETIIKIIINDIDGEHIFLCVWLPFKEDNYKDELPPSKSFLGTAKVIDRGKITLGFNVWQQNDNEFIYYAIV